MTKLLVVGGTGFIGYHIIKEAKKRKWNVTSVSLNKPKIKRFHKNVIYKKANISDLNKLKKMTNTHFDYVVNAGGYGKNPNFGKSGDILFKSHFLGTVNLVKILNYKKLKKYIQIGSSAEYGNANAPQIENMLCNPKTPYGIAKLACTNFLQNFNKINNFPSTVLRLFQVYGSKQDKNRILPQIIDGCLRNKKFPVTKGEQYCDFCHIEDVVRAIFKTLKSKKSKGEIINIGSGKPIKIKNIVFLVKKIIRKGKPQFGKIKYGKNINMKLFPNIKKARGVIGWVPKVSLIKGLKNTINNYNEK